MNDADAADELRKTARVYEEAHPKYGGHTWSEYLTCARCVELAALHHAIKVLDERAANGNFSGRRRDDLPMPPA